MRNYTFRPLTEGDLPLMGRWLNTAHVKAWWPGAETQIARMQDYLKMQEMTMIVVGLINRPFAYLQEHDARSFAMPQFADLPRGARVMSTFVGDTDFMGQGHSVGYIEARVRDLRLRYPQVAVGPNSTDTRAISIFRQAGFMNRRLAPTRDGRLVQVMTHN